MMLKSSKEWGTGILQHCDYMLHRFRELSLNSAKNGTIKKFRIPSKTPERVEFLLFIHYS
jgi:hypothetical protein